MKKTLYFALGACVLGLASCAGNEQKADTTDSVEIVAPDSAADSAAASVDTVAAPAQTEAVKEEANPEKDLTLEVTKKNLKHVPESTFYEGSWTVKVTNNGASEIKGNEYVVAYTETKEDQNSDGDLVEVNKKRTAPGKDVAPGESVEIILKAKDGCQGFSNPKIKAAK